MDDVSMSDENTEPFHGYEDESEDHVNESGGSEYFPSTVGSTDNSQTLQSSETPTADETPIRITRARLRSAQAGSSAHPPPPTAAAKKEEKPKKQSRAAIRKQIVEAGTSSNFYTDQMSLYSLICSGRYSLTHVVDEWIEQYKSNRETALLALMQFFINASGCKGKILPSMAADMEYAAIIRKMTEEFDEETFEYPLIMSGQTWKKFRQTYCDFVALLVKQCQYSIIYDQYLMDNLISLFTGLSDSQVRAFRHTATLGAMKLMTALVDVSLIVSINSENTQRQYDAEMAKTRDKRALDRLESLMAKKQELFENTEEIKSMLTYLFKSVFVHRYRDILPEIRAVCMAEIGIWMKKYSHYFLDDSYLKYIGWTLHDKVGEVRLRCLQTLQPLYASEELKGKLELFTSKFKDRIVAMTLDKEYDVAVQAVKLVTSILKHHKDILTDKDCEHVYELVYSSHRAVAQAAGEFLNERLFAPDNMGQTIRTRNGKKRLPNTPLIRDLVQFFIESELHEHGAYLVDSLIDSNDMMKDWECMTDLLLEEPGPQEEPLDDQQETSLIEIMTCAIRQASTGEAPVGRGPNRRMTSTKEAKQITDDRQKLTEHFIKTLPLLLDRYRADTDKLINLLSLPQYFDLNIYVASRQEANLDFLLRKIQLITDMQEDTEVLEMCAKTLEVLCSQDNTVIRSRCDVQKNALLDSISNNFKFAIKEWANVYEAGETPDDDETYKVIMCTKKMATFYACHNLGHFNVWFLLFTSLRDAVHGRQYLPPEAVKNLVWSCFYGTQWDLLHLEELAENGSGIGIKDLVLEVKRRLGDLMGVLKEMLQHETSMFQEEAYLAICDLLIVFCNQLNTSSYSVLSDLIYEPDRNLQEMLNNFIQTNVFVYEEEDENDDHSKIEALHKRRNFLASYCKLIVYGVMPTSCAADVFKHYIKSYHEYGDIIKTTVGKARELNKVNCAKTMVASLTALFKEMKANDVVIVSRQNSEFSALKELAKRFALSFGLDSLKNREAVTTLHREGISYAVSEVAEDPSSPPPNLLFLEVLSEFTNKLLKQDKRMILNYLDRRIPGGMPSSRSEDFQSLLTYRTSLVHGESDMPALPSRRAYARKRKEAEEELGEEEEQLSDGAGLVDSKPENKTATEMADQAPMAATEVTNLQNIDPPSITLVTRPQRQCTARSLAYKFVYEASEDEY